MLFCHKRRCNVEIDQLRAFVQTARDGSFSAAAQALGLTQPGVSRRIQQLEQELGFLLFDREQRPVALTPAGREFLACAEAILNDLDITVQRLASGRSCLSGQIVVAASTIPGEFLVPGLLARFKMQHPQVRPILVVADSAGVVHELLARHAEVGFLGAPMVRRRLRLIPFAEDEIVLIAPPSHPLAAKREIELADLAGQPLVEREDGSGTIDSLRRLLARQGRSLPEHHVAMVVSSSQALLSAVEAEIGLGFVSSLALSSRPNAAVSAISIRGVRLRRTLYMAHEHAPLSAIAQAFVKFALEQSRELKTGALPSP